MGKWTLTRDFYPSATREIGSNTCRYLLRAYHGSGTSSVVESRETWATKAEAQLAADRANAGDESGLTFALYADD